jgi:predicted glycosyltransferase involved in capsule biosynthesis
MVMVFLFSNLERSIHINSLVENHLEVCLIENHQEEDHLIETHLEDYHQIHVLDFMDRKHLIQGYSCHHGINQF